MKKSAGILATLVLNVAFVSMASAYTISFDATTKDADGVLTTNQVGAIVWNFNGGLNTMPSLYTGYTANNASVVSGSIDGSWAQPGRGSANQDNTQYLEVGTTNVNTPGITVTLNQLYTYFGLYWGSIDNYNYLSFYNGSTLVDSFRGDQITALEPAPANGDQASKLTNVYVNFHDLPTFNSFRLTSTSAAFEVDNIAVANTKASDSVPEPATLILFGTGLAGLAGLRLRRKK